MVEDVLAFHREPVEDYVRRRHADLKTHGARNPEIFAHLAEELAHRVVAAPGLSERQHDGSSTDRGEEHEMCGSLGTSAPSRRRRCCWRVWDGWSTGATTRRVSPCSARARRAGCGSRRRPAGSATSPTAAQAVRREGRHRPHPLGDPRARDDVNAHPHVDTKGDVAVVHNGIIDNAAVLRAGLADAGIDLASDTDTEVLAHLIGRSEAETLEGKVVEALARVEGTYGLAVLHAAYPDRIVVARNGSPLIIGIGDHEMFVASDLAALVRYTTRVAHLDDGELATLTADGFTTYRQDLSHVARTATDLEIDASAYDAGVHESYMHKEMLEQPEAAERVLRGRLDERFGTSHLGGLEWTRASCARSAG